MLKELPAFVTVVQVIRAMGIKPEKHLCWRVGDLMENWFRRNLGSQPIKDNAPQTYKGGSHCFAHYPRLLVPVIENFVKMCVFERERQGELFKDEPDAILEGPVPPRGHLGLDGSSEDIEFEDIDLEDPDEPGPK